MTCDQYRTIITTMNPGDAPAALVVLVTHHWVHCLACQEFIAKRMVEEGPLTKADEDEVDEVVKRVADAFTPR